jgi:hypothetical protein
VGRQPEDCVRDGCRSTRVADHARTHLRQEGDAVRPEIVMKLQFKTSRVFPFFFLTPATPLSTMCRFNAFPDAFPDVLSERILSHAKVVIGRRTGKESHLSFMSSERLLPRSSSFLLRNAHELRRAHSRARPPAACALKAIGFFWESALDSGECAVHIEAGKKLARTLADWTLAFDLPAPPGIGARQHSKHIQ